MPFSFPQILVLISDCLCPAKSKYTAETPGKSSKRARSCGLKCKFVGGRAIHCSDLRCEPIIQEQSKMGLSLVCNSVE